MLLYIVLTHWEYIETLGGGAPTDIWGGPIPTPLGWREGGKGVGGMDREIDGWMGGYGLMTWHLEVKCHAWHPHNRNQ